MVQRTGEKDVVLIYIEDKPFSFARVEEIREDWKKGWYHVTLLLLQVPLQLITWILKDLYIDGGEFTMDGNRMRLEKVVCPDINPPLPDPEPEKEDKHPGPVNDSGGKVISFDKRKKQGA